ncbi:MAG: TPM domain-containing protein [Acidobacteria bacterium]|nr:TPM domain-containing protein [Acidobacteriota bacterium]MBI3471967.1 TPM domain-containing protein [Candidatus Solibacter usitatus]
MAAARAVDWKALKPEGYVSDFARVVDGASRAEIERYCRAVERQTGAQISLVTIQTLAGEPVEDVANTIFRAWGVGEKGKNNGILLLLAVGERRSRLEVGYELEQFIPDGFAGDILRAMRPGLRQGHYGEGLLAAAHTIGERVAQGKKISLDTAPRRRIRERAHESIPWPLLLGGLFVALMVLRGLSRMGGGGGGGGFWTGMLLGNMMGRHWDSGSRSGGGGFGGYDSSDGFGGFGGGDSGGGGASSDW